MIKSALHITRLKLLSKYLKKAKFEEDYSHVGYSITRRGTCIYFFKGQPYLLHPAILIGMTLLFKQHFRKNYNGINIYGPKKTSVFFALQYFFGLNHSEFERIFLVQDLNSPIKRYYLNIYRFLREIKNEPLVDEHVHIRRVLFEKRLWRHSENILLLLQKSVTQV